MRQDKNEEESTIERDIRVVRSMDRGVLGQKQDDLVPLPITDDRNENPDYAAWEDI